MLSLGCKSKKRLTKQKIDQIKKEAKDKLKKSNITINTYFNIIGIIFFNCTAYF